MAVTLPTDDPSDFAKALVAEFEVLADANAGDLTAATTWAEAEIVALDATLNNADDCRMFVDATAVMLDNFHRTYVYTP